MGVARGSAVVQFGGQRGRKLRLKAGDVIVLPAGTGHRRVSASKDFLVIGAYPATGTYDICRTSPDEHDRALAGADGGVSGHRVLNVLLHPREVRPAMKQGPTGANRRAALRGSTGTADTPAVGAE